MIRVELITKRGCHLCEDAEQTVSAICGELGVNWQKRSIEDDPRLAAQYFESVPVVLVDGRSHAMYRVDAQRLRSALTGPDEA